MFNLILKNHILSRLGIKISLFTISSAVLSSCIYVASGKIVFNLSLITTFSFSFKRLLIATTACLVCGIVLLFFKKMVGSSYSKLKSKDSGKGRNFEGVGGNPSMSLLPPLLPLGTLFAVSSLLNLLGFFKLQDVVLFLNLLLTASS